MGDKILLNFSEYELLIRFYEDNKFYEERLIRYTELPDEETIRKKIDSLIDKRHIDYWDSCIDKYNCNHIPYLGTLIEIRKIYKETNKSEDIYKKCISSVFHFPNFLYGYLPSIRLKKLLGVEI